MPVIMEGILRAIFAFIVLLVLTRLVGRRQFSQLTFFDFVTGTAIGAMGAIMATNMNVNIWGVFAAFLTFMVLLILNGYAALESRPLRKLLQGEPVVVIHNGKILEGNMGVMRYSMDDLMTGLREKGYFDFTQVEFAVLETDGRLSVLAKSQNRPVTPGDLKVPTKYEGAATELVMDGKIIEPNLAQNNLSKDWLLSQFKSQGVYNVSEVFYAALGTDGKLYIDKKQDTLDKVTDISDKEI